jgi:hypothetical protein
MKLDVTSEENWAAAIEAIVKKARRLDVLIMACDESSYVTGTELAIDNGYLAQKRQIRGSKVSTGAPRRTSASGIVVFEGKCCVTLGAAAYASSWPGKK